MEDENAHLQPDFDANSVKISELRRILIEHDVTTGGAVKKSELIELFEREIRPKAAKILAKRERVRASSRGIEDARENNNNTSTSKATMTPARPRKSTAVAQAAAAASEDEQYASIKSPEIVKSSRSSARKSMSMNNLASIADGGPATATAQPKKRKSTSTPTTAPTRTSMRRSASVEIQSVLSEQEEEDEERAGDADMEATPGVSKKRSSSSTKTATRSARPSVKPAVDATVMEVDEPEEIQPVVSEKAVVRRKSTVLSPTKPVVEIPYRRPSSDIIETGIKRKHKPATVPAPVEDEETKAESGFSDYNPFQDSPDREKSPKKRRKSSLGPTASATDPSDEVGSGIRRSATMQALGSKRKSTGEVADDTFYTSSSAHKSLPGTGSREAAIPAVPAIPAAYASAGPSRLSSSKSMSSLSKASSTPLQGLRTRPEDFNLSLSPTKQETVSEARSAKKASPTDAPSTLHTPREASTRARGRQSMPAATAERQTRSNYVPELTQVDQQVLDDLSNEPLMAGREVASDDDEEDSVTVAASRAPETVSRLRKISSQEAKPVKRGPPPPERAVVQAAETVVTPAKTQGVVIRPAKSTLPKAVQTLGAALPLLALFGSYGKYWAAQKQSLGFCDTEATANRAVIHQRMQQVTAPKPYTSNPAIDSLLKDSIVYLTPDTCEACPAHAICEDGQVKSCTKDYILQPNAVAFLFSDGLDPHRSIAPVLFKPYCRPDTERLVRVAETASQISSFLRAFKGNIICSGEEKARRKSALRDRNGQPEEWAVYGASQDWLKKVIYDKKNPRIPDAMFDDIFEQAVLDLISHNEVIHGIDQEAEAWVAAIAADLPLGCRTRLAAYNAAAEHKTSLAGLAAALLAALYGRVKLAQKKAIGEQVEELVPIALQLLQAQEQNHHIDNVIHPTPYLAPAQLRDLVLSHEHSPARRAELWKRVEKIVEGNSNVRAKVAEQHGEEMRVWQWVGGSYGLLEEEEDVTGTPEASSVRRRKSYGGLTARSSLSRPGTPRVNTPGRHITWSKDVRNQDSPI